MFTTDLHYQELVASTPTTIERRRIARTCAAIALAVAAVTQVEAQAQTLIASDFYNGHYYEVYTAYGIVWPTAQANAQALTQSGVAGHLATTTTAAEDAFVDNLRRQAVADNELDRSEFWIGGSQSTDGAEPGGGWSWVNGEGAIPADNFQAAYANWLNDEPNNAGGNEEHLTLGRIDGTLGWNDEGNLSLIAGYIVEYDLPVATSTCSDASGCESVPGIQTITLPAPVDTGTIAFQRFDFTDPRVAANTCGSAQLSLFDGALVIPPYLCGSPHFLVVRTATQGFEVLQGTVLIENEPLTGNLYECEATLADPLQHRDVVVWQATDRTTMVENSSIGGSISSQLVGTAGEYTDGCGSSLGRGRGASYFVVGMHIDFGISYALDPLGVYQHFVTLTRYKLLLLKEAVRRAANDRAITRVTAAALQALVDLTIHHLGRGRNTLALINIKLFNALAGVVRITTIPGKNYDGEFEARGSNIEFMLEDKLIPNEP